MEDTINTCVYLDIYVLTGLATQWIATTCRLHAVLRSGFFRLLLQYFITLV